MNVQKKTPERFGQALFNLSTVGYIVITMLIVSYLSAANVVSTHARTFIYLVGFSFGKLVVIYDYYTIYDLFKGILTSYSCCS